MNNKKDIQMEINNPILLTQTQAAKYIGTTVGTLNTWRHYGRNPLPYIKWGNRIKYRKEDLDAWIAENTINPNKKEDGDVQA